MMPNSLKYIAFLTFTAVFHALTPKRGRNLLLLAASWLIWCHRSNIKRLLRGEEPKTVIAKRKPR